MNNRAINGNNIKKELTNLTFWLKKGFKHPYYLFDRILIELL
jgi:hypothetical protein